MPKSLSTPWYNKTIDALQLAGMSESTQESYARAVRMLIEHFEKDPRRITEAELQSYFLYRRNETRWSPSTLKIRLCAQAMLLHQRTATRLAPLQDPEGPTGKTTPLRPQPERSLPHPSQYEKISQLRLPGDLVFLRS